MIDDDTVVAGQSADEQPNAAPEHQPEAQEQSRGLDGKFAGKANEQPAQDGSEEKVDDRKGWIPPQAHDAEKARRRKLQEQLNQLQGYVQALQTQPKAAAPTQEPPKPLPDWYTDPDAAAEARYGARIKQLEEKLAKSGEDISRPVIEKFSRIMAVKDHGLAAVQEAYDAAHQAMSADPAFNAAMKARLNASDHPMEEIVRWHKESAALQRVGNDPEAFIEAEVARRLAELQAGNGQQLPGQSQQRAPVLPERLPADFSNARNAGGRGQPAYGGPKSLDELYGR